MERAVCLGNPNAGTDVADDLRHDSFVAGLQDKDLWKWVHQAQPRTFTEAHATALQGEACFRAEEDQGAVQMVAQKSGESGTEGLGGTLPRCWRGYSSGFKE